MEDGAKVGERVDGFVMGVLPGSAPECGKSDGVCDVIERDPMAIEFGGEGPVTVRRSGGCIGRCAVEAQDLGEILLAAHVLGAVLRRVVLRRFSALFLASCLDSLSR